MFHQNSVLGLAASKFRLTVYDIAYWFREGNRKSGCLPVSESRIKSDTRLMQRCLQRPFLIVMLVWGMFFGLVAAAAAAENVTVTDLAGNKIRGTISSWSDQRMVIATESAQEIAREKIRSVLFERPNKKALTSGSLVWLSNGDRIAARATSTKSEKLNVSWSLFGDTNPIPLERVTAVLFEIPENATERNRLFADIQTTPPGSDLVMLSNGDRTNGNFQQLDSSFVSLEGTSGVLRLDRSRVRVIRMNPELTTSMKTPGRRTIVTLIDGSRITATAIDLNNETLKLNSIGLGAVTLSISSVVSCEFLGNRVVPIGDREPNKIEFTPYLSNAWTLVRNANCLHGPLTLRGSEFATGVGMHSQMSATYELKGNEIAFQSVVGIDDAANGNGSVIFAVEVDGNRVWTSEEITGKSAAVTIPSIPLKGNKRIKLIVEFGQYADVADYANWCDAIFVLEQK